MKQILFILTIIAVSINTNAQPILNNAYNYAVGDTAVIIECEATGLTAGSSGNNATWNFKHLVTNEDYTIHVNSTSTGAFAAEMSYASYVLAAKKGSVESYPISDQSSFSIAGEAVDGTFLKYNNPKRILERPVMYNPNQYNLDDSFTTEYDIAQSFPVTGAGYTYTITDAYGTLVLPDTIITNVMRLKQYSVQSDTIHQFLSADSIVTTTSVTYYWFDTVHKTPLLRLDSVHAKRGVNVVNVKQAEMLYIPQPPTNVSSVSSSSEQQLVAHINNNSILLSADMSIGKDYTVSLYGIDGKQLLKHNFRATGKKLHIPIKTSLPSGVYIVWLQEKGGLLRYTKTIK